MSIANEILNWKEADAKYLENLINEYNVDIEEIRIEVNEIDNINEWIECVLYKAGSTFLKKVDDYICEKDIYKMYYPGDEEMSIYTNYIDSGFDSVLNDYDLTNFSERNIKNFLEDINY
jgi:hypothetical protein